jgi:hypothetical protein
MDKDEECLGRDGRRAASSYVLSLPSLLTLEPKSAFALLAAAPDQQPKLAETTFCCIFL